jgi:hypothetical protein
VGKLYIEVDKAYLIKRLISLQLVERCEFNGKEGDWGAKPPQLPTNYLYDYKEKC